MADVLALLGDTLPYTLESLLGLRRYFNEQVWPLQALIFLLLLAVIPGVQSTKWVWRNLQAWILVACWLLCGLVYQSEFAAMLDWTAGYSAWLLVLQGMLIAIHTFLVTPLSVEVSRRSFTGLTLMLAALIAMPLLQWMSGVPFQSLALAGLDPLLTAMFTSGWLLDRRDPWWLWPVPLTWLAMELAIGLGLGYIPAMLPLPITVLALIIHQRIRTPKHPA